VVSRFLPEIRISTESRDAIRQHLPLILRSALLIQFFPVNDLFLMVYLVLPDPDLCEFEYVWNAGGQAA
jgi:hypothetical protein